MDTDPTESARREMLATGQPAADLTEDRDRKYTTQELQEHFEVRSFLAPFVVVRRKSDGAMGSMEFTNSPRTYFGFRTDPHGRGQSAAS